MLLNVSFFIGKKFIREWGSNCQSLEKFKKITRLNFLKLDVFICQKSIFCHYCVQNVEDGIQLWVYMI